MRQLSIQVTIYKSKPLQDKLQCMVFIADPLAHIEQQALNVLQNITSVKPFKRENQRSNLYKRETRNTYEPNNQTKTTEHQIPDLGQVQTIAAVLNVLMVFNLLPFRYKL